MFNPIQFKYSDSVATKKLNHFRKNEVNLKLIDNLSLIINVIRDEQKIRLKSRSIFNVYNSCLSKVNEVNGNRFEFEEVRKFIVKSIKIIHQEWPSKCITAKELDVKLMVALKKIFNGSPAILLKLAQIEGDKKPSEELQGEKAVKIEPFSLPTCPPLFEKYSAPAYKKGKLKGKLSVQEKGSQKFPSLSLPPLASLKEASLPNRIKWGKGAPKKEEHLTAFDAPALKGQGKCQEKYLAFQQQCSHFGEEPCRSLSSGFAAEKHFLYLSELIDNSSFAEREFAHLSVLIDNASSAESEFAYLSLLIDSTAIESIF